MQAAFYSFRVGLEGFPPGSVGAVGETRAGTLRAGKAGKDRACVRARPAFPLASSDPAQIALDSHLSGPFGSFPHKKRGVIRDRVALGSLKILQGGLLGWGCCYERENRMLRHEEKATPSGAPAEQSDIVAGCLAVLIAETRRLGLRRDLAFRLLCDAPGRIADALSKGPGALVVWRLDKAAPVSLVTEDEGRLQRFVARADDVGAGMLGLNPARIAAALAASGGAGLNLTPAKIGGQHDRALH